MKDLSVWKTAPVDYTTLNFVISVLSVIDPTEIPGLPNMLSALRLVQGGGHALVLEGGTNAKDAAVR